MKRILFFVGYVIIMMGTLQAQTLTQTIKGSVIDALGDYPIIGATVAIFDATEQQLTGTATDANGYFELTDIPMGRHSLVVQYLGYEPAQLSNLLVASGKALDLTIELREKVTELPTAVVGSSKNEDGAINGMANGSVRIISMEAMQRFSGGFADPARMVQNYAGISGANDDRNDIIVRGNSPTGVGWRLEGIDIPSPNHWGTLGTTGGPVSMLNANNLRNSDFHSGAFAAEYGNATAAVFDLHLRNGNAREYEFLGQMGFNGFELGAEGPVNIGQGASFITNLRYSTLGVFQQLGINFGTGAAIPVYRDGVFKLNVPTKKHGTVSLWGMGGISDITFFDSNDNIYSQGSGRIQSGTNTGVIGLTHQFFINKFTSSKLSLAVTGSHNLNTTARWNPDPPGNFITNFVGDQRQTKYALHWNVNRKFSASDRVKIGFMGELYDLSVVDSVRSGPDNWFKETDFSGQLQLWRAYAQWQHIFNDRLTMNAGVHTALLTLNQSYAVEPRLGLNYQLNSRQYLQLSYGWHSQLQPLPIYFSTAADATEAEIAANRELDMIRSHHFVLGHNLALREDISLKTEVYHQQLSGLAVDPFSSSFSMINAGANFAFPNRLGLVNDGLGRNTGLELTLEKRMRSDYYFLLTSSVFRSEYQGADGVWRNTFYNSTFVTNALAGKEWVFSQKWKLSLDARCSYAGGRRYTPINLEASRAAGREVRDFDRAFEAQLAPYFRLDFKIAVQNNERRYSQTWAVDLVNLTGHDNEFNKSYNATIEQITTSYQRGFFPNVLYQIHF